MKIHKKRFEGSVMSYICIKTECVVSHMASICNFLLYHQHFWSFVIQKPLICSSITASHFNTINHKKEKLSKISRTCIVALGIVHPSFDFRNFTTSLTKGNSSRTPFVILCSDCAGDATCSMCNFSLEKRGCQRAA